MKLRSLLYVPASSEKFIAKAHERGADAIILDLEDAVAPADKTHARENLAEAVPSVGQNGAKVFVRINAEPELQLDDAAAACRQEPRARDQRQDRQGGEPAEALPAGRRVAGPSADGVGPVRGRAMTRRTSRTVHERSWTCRR